MHILNMYVMHTNATMLSNQLIISLQLYSSSTVRREDSNNDIEVFIAVSED